MGIKVRNPPALATEEYDERMVRWRTPDGCFTSSPVSSASAVASKEAAAVPVPAGKDCRCEARKIAVIRRVTTIQQIDEILLEDHLFSQLNLQQWIFYCGKTAASEPQPCRIWYGSLVEPSIMERHWVQNGEFAVECLPCSWIGFQAIQAGPRFPSLITTAVPSHSHVIYT
ncbi:hypothetical protein NE237_028655 [Protea cynaroides]|uniref:Uncharacterized protein n=1 Tax=Protea cynaroides TaxID=273540 RepID=A0A9Q0GQC3_9MAGN|nr:hypothetical protein NE237_028655 [Protea cynaroides]